MQNYVDQLSRELQQRNYSPRTVEIYSNCLQYFLKWFVGDVAKITREKIVDFILYLQNKGRAPKTVNLYKEVIKCFVKIVLKFDIALDIKLSKQPKKLPVVLSRVEIQSMIDVLINRKHKTLIALSYAAGLRV